MQVFHEAIEKNGGPLPLAYYLQPTVGSNPDEGPLKCSKAMDLLNTRIDRRTFFECLLHDKCFAILNAFLVSGVPVNAVREEDGATALHIATAATLDVLDEHFFMSISESDSNHAVVSRNPTITTSSLDTWELEEDARHRTDRVLDPPCVNQLILSFLVDNGADVNEPMHNRLRQTPLMVAAVQQNIKVTKLLLAKGAGASAQDALGRTVLTYAARYPLLLEVFRLWMGEENFFNAAVRERLLHVVCRTVGNHYAALYLIEQVQMDVNARDSSAGERDNSSAFGTISNGHGSPTSVGADALPSYRPSPTTAAAVAVAAFPASNNKNIWALGRSSRGTVAAGQQASPVSPNFDSHNNNNSNFTTAVEMMSMVSHSGDTPLHCAVSTGDVALVRALLSKGADVHAENGSGVSPLRLAQSQSQSQVRRSFKQCCKEELLLLLWPSSSSAIAARRRRLEQRHERNPAKVRAILMAFNNATPGPSQEKLVREEAAQYIWQICTFTDFLVQFLPAMFLPHAFYYCLCFVLRNFFLLLLPLPLLYAVYVEIQRRDSYRLRSRPLTGIGWCFGFVLMEGLCLPLFTTRYYYQYYSFELEDHAAISWWLIPSCIITFLLLVYLLVLSSPGVVTSSEGQRKGIYASLRNAKGNYSKELLYGIDLRTMVKKPLRAQYCVQLQRVVLRFDQYCTYMSTVIGGGNQRAFFWMHVSILVLLSCFYHYAREYHRIMSRIADVAQASAGTAGQMDRVVFQKLAVTPFSTAELRFGYMYTQVILPIMIGMDVYVLYHQLRLILRNLTRYDLHHAEDESSVYCFKIDATTYSLYDHGRWANLREFFGWSSFTQLMYRVPQINPYLQKIVEEHQRWLLSTGDGCCGDHAHGPNISLQHSHGNSGAGMTAGGEQVGPTEYNDDASARQRQAVAAVQSIVRPLPPSIVTTTKAAAEGISVRAGQPALEASGSTRSLYHNNNVNNSTAASQQQIEGHKGEEYNENADATDERAQANSVLVMQLFQQMVRSGSTDVGRGVDNAQGGSAATYGAMTGGGHDTDSETQREWDAAVLKARQMFDFYQQSLGRQDEED